MIHQNIKKKDKVNCSHISYPAPFCIRTRTSSDKKSITGNTFLIREYSEGSEWKSDRICVYTYIQYSIGKIKEGGLFLFTLKKRTSPKLSVMFIK
jgi:hypothetical protein